jgi:hypothetical protein
MEREATMELLERTHASELAHAVRGAAGAAASQASEVAHKAGDVAHKAGDRASELIDPLVDPLFKGRRRRSTWGGVVRTAQRHPWAVAATVAVLVGITYVAMRDATRAGLDIDDVAADADAANRFRSAA